MTVTLLFKSDNDRPEAWVPALRQAMPELDIRVWPEVGNPEDITYALLWQPPDGVLGRCRNLKAILSLGAGVDHLMGDPELPDHLPIVRMVDPSLTDGMSEYVLFHTLRYHRDVPYYEACQRERKWHMLTPVMPQERRVGILGLGVLGADAARKLAALSFDVAGWSRSPKQVEDVASFHGTDGLAAFLARSEILVCLLPLTPDTAGILNAELFAGLPEGACLINPARGGHLVDDDLLAALDSGRIAGATLDVFHTEPLPTDHPFWDHPKVTITPHVASVTNPKTAAEQVAANIRRAEAGEPLPNLVDRTAGY